MTTLETNPIAFFFRPLSSTPLCDGVERGGGTDALSIARPYAQPDTGASGECPKSTASTLYVAYKPLGLA